MKTTQLGWLTMKQTKMMRITKMRRKKIIRRIRYLQLRMLKKVVSITSESARRNAQNAANFSLAGGATIKSISNKNWIPEKTIN